jgi:hypothetical protein
MGGRICAHGDRAAPHLLLGAVPRRVKARCTMRFNEGADMGDASLNFLGTGTATAFEPRTKTYARRALRFAIGPTGDPHRGSEFTASGDDGKLRSMRGGGACTWTIAIYF